MNSGICLLFFKFLDDLTDADVLIHVVDASGTADADGNCVGVEGGTHPLQDLAWVRKELLEWISCNMEAKWDTVIRKGQNRVRLVSDTLVPMFWTTEKEFRNHSCITFHFFTRFHSLQICLVDTSKVSRLFGIFCCK